MQAKRYECRQCGHQDKVTSGTIRETLKLPLTILFFALYQLGQPKTSLSSLQLNQQLGVAYNMGWMHNSHGLHVMSERDEYFVL
jgi:hypothetical protein